MMLHYSQSIAYKIQSKLQIPYKEHDKNKTLH